jgi:hypothetical protein
MRRLYISSVRYAGFREAIRRLDGDETYSAETLEEALAHLDFVDEVVFVDRQEEVFGTVDNYLKYIMKIKINGKKTVSVRDEEDELPNSDEGIDRVVVNKRGKVTIPRIARQVTANMMHYD